ncbi:L,D-transpeptidase family protein [Neobacillus sp. LXY-1]|uniref:L,D-transpeptidase n=1 Tax=Neobacillus sp. LXY-1 TaxID=3379133 RepID=UPI003EDFFF03
MKKITAVMILIMGIFFYTDHTEASSNQLIIINKKTNTLAFYSGGTLVRTFKVATGKTRGLTPEGLFRIVTMIKNRPYYTGNIPGGSPRNPLGDRWLGLNAAGTNGDTYAIHGNNNESSIGKYISHGCVRMHNAEVRWLFGQVQMNTPVIITFSEKSFEAIALANGFTVSGGSVPVYGSIDGVSDGWSVADGKKYYYEDGKPKTGWQIIADNKYYFNSKGVMQTGWLDAGGKRYYLDQNGIMRIGWLEINGRKYFLGNDGSMVIGWLEDGTKKYYLDQAGIVKTGWLELEGKKYYFESDGAMKFGWLDDSGKKYYFDQSGIMKTGWLEEHTQWYYFDQLGDLQTGWINDKGTWYYINSNGVMNLAIHDLNGTSDSSELKSGWLALSGKRYFLGRSESVVTGWLEYQDRWYYLNVGSVMLANSQLDSQIHVKE